LRFQEYIGNLNRLGVHDNTDRFMAFRIPIESAD